MITREVHLVTPILNGQHWPTSVLYIPDPYGEVAGPNGIEFDADILGYPEGERLTIPMSNIAMIRSVEDDE